MQPQILTSALSRSVFSDIQLVATDMDGTLTDNGELTPKLLQAFSQLRHSRIALMIVTGRSAGWVSALVNYLPVVGAIAENGGLYIDKQHPTPTVLPDIPRMSQHRDRLEKLFRKIQTRYPHLQPSTDNRYRLTDWTFDIAGLTTQDLIWMQKICASQSLGFTYSTVQCHLKVQRQNTAAGLNQVLQHKFPHLSAKSVVTVGDSPNDASLFDSEQFPYSVGVANVAHYLPELPHSPTYLTTHAEAKGFAELVSFLVR